MKLARLLFFFFITSCQSIEKKPTNSAAVEPYLQFYDLQIILEKKKQHLTRNGSQIWNQFFGNDVKTTNLMNVRRKLFLLYFQDDIDPYSNKVYPYSSCLVDTKAPDRIIFYYGNVDEITNCINQENRNVGVRLWKQCPQGFYEVTVAPINVIEGIDIICPATEN